MLWKGGAGYKGRIAEISEDKYQIYIDKVDVGGIFSAALDACECSGWKVLSYRKGKNYDTGTYYYGRDDLIWVPKSCVTLDD